MFNQEYWNIDSPNVSGADKFGVLVSGDKGILHSFAATKVGLEV